MPRSDDARPPSASAEEAGLRFQTLHVRRFNGLDHELEVELCDDVNVIYGSNASGKTTLAHALRALLWPDQVGDQLPIVEGRFSLGGAAWQVDLDGQSCDYQKNQSPESPPALPPSAHSRRYHLYLHDLLGGAADPQDFARLILREAQGGIDVEGAAQALGFEVPTRRKSKTARAVEELRSDVRQAKSEQESLREDERRLRALREQRADAQAEAERAAALDQAVEVAQARTRHEEAEAALDSFPAVLAEVRGNEVDRLEALQEQMQTADNQREEAEAQRQEAQATIDESRIPEAGLPDGHLEEIRSATGTLQEQERTVRDLKADLEAAREEEAAAWDRLPAGVDREKAATIDLPEVQAVETHVQAVEDIQGKQEALATAEDLFADAAPDVSVETLREGLRQLHRWLQAPAPQQSEGPGAWRRVLLASGVLVAGSGLLLVVSGQGVALWVGPVLILLGGLVVVAEVVRRSESGGTDQRALYAQEFERVGLDAPGTWSREAVEQRADQLLDRLRTTAVAAEKQETWSRLRPRREEVEAKADDLAAERRRLAEDLGLDPDVSSRSLSWLVDRLSQWQTAYDEREGTNAALQEAETEAEARRTRLNDLLAPYDLGPVAEASEAQGAVEALESAWDEFREARRSVEQAEEKKQSAAAAHEEAEAQLSALYERLDLEVGAEEALRSLIEQHDDYEAAVDTERTARATLETERRQLHRSEGYEEWMEAATEADLKQEREAARAEADREEQYLDEIKDIEHAIESAREGGTLEHLQAEYRQKRTQLVKDREQDYDRAVGSVIADLVQEETRDRGLPPVFHRARALFADVTNDRYELQLDREHATFRAYDHVYDQPFSLDALSSGTKVQLLLSVRVAFVETQEQGCRVPLVLDETLATSDADRARALIDAVQTICRSGRQVLYLTAQADEVQKWRTGLQDDDAVEHAVLSLSDLDERDRLAAGDGASVPARRTPAELPDPDTTTHEALRERLDVPRWIPRQPVSRLHLWYLVETPGSLLRLIEAGTRTWGQLRFQHQRGGLPATGLSEDDFVHVRALARAAESWKEAWQVGRGRPVDRPALEQTDAVTDTFIDGVSALAKELDGDAEALLREVRARDDERVRGFRSAKADDLETYLRENGFLDPRDRHSPEQMWQYVLADLAGDRQNGRVALDDLDRLFERLRGATPSRPTE